MGLQLTATAFNLMSQKRTNVMKRLSKVTFFTIEGIIHDVMAVFMGEGSIFGGDSFKAGVSNSKCLAGRMRLKADLRVALTNDQKYLC